ncbi:hypothetical protein CHITON_1175 [Thermococcus chitonophagus]|uniref:Uncharacterized protein n=1 Tax=Thermococcus chitonophagus TaxID=54262 RepID=A0A170SL74_9EURY|nr:hypothetical protein CHITON_1175 [Thermococcus chitonophagus]
MPTNPISRKIVKICCGALMTAPKRAIEKTREIPPISAT